MRYAALMVHLICMRLLTVCSVQLILLEAFSRVNQHMDERRAARERAHRAPAGGPSGAAGTVRMVSALYVLAENF